MNAQKCTLQLPLLRALVGCDAPQPGTGPALIPHDGVDSTDGGVCKGEPQPCGDTNHYNKANNRQHTRIPLP